MATVANAAPPTPAPAPSAPTEDDAVRPDDPDHVRQYSLYEHAAREALIQQMAAEGDPDGVARAMITWEDALQERHDRAVADVWRKAGRFLLASGSGTERGAQDWGTFAWRRLYLTEVAPWADYAEGDEYRYLGMAPPA